MNYYQNYWYPYPSSWKTCSACGGNGVNNGSTCWSCNGTGWQRVYPQPQPPPFIPPWKPQPPFIVPPPAKWVPQCTCGSGNPPNSICPVHPNKTF